MLMIVAAILIALILFAILRKLFVPALLFFGAAWLYAEHIQPVLVHAGLLK